MSDKAADENDGVSENDDNDDHRSGRSSAWALIGTAVGSIANFAVLLVVTAIYGQTLFGVFSAVTALFQLSGVLFRLGAEVGCTYTIARQAESDRPPTARRALLVGLVPAGLVSLAIATVGVAGSDWVAGLLAAEENRDSYASMLRVVALALPFATTGEILLGATRGFGSMRPTVLASNFGRQGGQLLTVGAVALLDGSLQALAFAWALPYLGTVLYPAYWLRQATAHVDPAVEPGWGPFWRYASPQAANAAVQGGLEKGDIILLNQSVGADATAVYSLANRFVHVVVLARYAINVSQAASFARGFAESTPAALNRLVGRVASWTTLLCGPVLWLLVLFPDAILTTIGAEYGAGTTALSVLAGAMLVSLLAGPAEGLLLMSGDSMRSFVNSAVALAINLSLNLWLIPRYGPSGAAIAWAVSLSVSRVLALDPLRRRHGLVAQSPVLFASLAMISVCFGGTGIALRILQGDTRSAAAIAIVLGVALYGAGLRRWSSALRLDELLSGLRPQRA